MNDAGQVEETFLSHEDLLVTLDCGEGLCDRESNVKKWCCVMWWLLVTCHSELGHHLRERVGVDLTLVQPPVPCRHPGYRELPLNIVRRHVHRNSRVLKTRYWITFLLR